MKPLIQPEQIRARATHQSYRRGQEYYEQGAIFATIRRGNELTGRCLGSADEPYHVTVMLDDEGNIEEAWCTCDYDYEGDCKHVVALLLTYLDSPDLFEARLPTQQSLAQRNKDELIALIQQMVERYPDLRTLIDRPTPRSAAQQKKLDLVPFQRELRQALNTFNHWGDRSAEAAVRSVAKAASAFAEAGQWRHAGALYRLILDECTGIDQYPADDEGEYTWALNSVLDAVVAALDQPEIEADEEGRRALVRGLADAYIWDIEMGGLGIGEGILPEAFLEHLQPEDVPAIRERVLAAQRRRQQSEYGRWSVQTLEAFQIELDALAGTAPEEIVQRLRQQKLYGLLFQKLIELGRVDEAIEVARQHLTSANERLTTLPLLVGAGRRGEAIHMAQATLSERFDFGVAEWLAQQYQAGGERQPLFELRMQCMRAHPDVQYYAALKQAAEAIGAWESVRPDLLARLARDRQDHVLAQIYLYEQEWDSAWEVVDRLPQQAPRSTWGWGGSSFDLEVAQRTKEVRPHKAIPVFVKYARQHISLRERQHYNRAADYLATARDLYIKTGQEDAWRELIAALRAEFRRLPALQDELNQAGL